MNPFVPTVLEVKFKNLPPKSVRSAMHQGFELKRVRGNATIVVLGEASATTTYSLPQGFQFGKSLQVQLMLYEQCTPGTKERSLVHSTAYGAPLRPFWTYQNIISPMGKDAAFSALHDIVSVLYDSTTKIAVITRTGFRRNGKTVFVFVDELWKGMIHVMHEVCPVCRSETTNCRGSRLCIKYRHRPIPALIQLPQRLEHFHNALLAAVRKTSGIIYPLFVNAVHPIKPKLIAVV